jgi:hypothetical protein
MTRNRKMLALVTGSVRQRRDVAARTRAEAPSRKRTKPTVLMVAAVTGLALAAGCGGGSDETVGTAQIEDGAVTSRKIADEAVTKEKIAKAAVGTARLEDGSVTLEKLAPDAVDSERIGDDSITGADVDESTLEGIDAATLNGSGSFVIDVQSAQQTSSVNANDRKGPVAATCPEGTTVISGGASVVTASGGKLPIALTASTSNAGNGWNAEAIEIRPVTEGWGLRVIALCGVVSPQ